MSAEMDALVNGVTNQLEALETALAGLRGVRGRFTSADRSVSAEVDGDGALTGLWLAESVTTRPPAEVAQLILWASREAAARATAQRAEVLAGLNESLAPGNVGGDPDSAQGDH
ncbi:YbaB/EbfC family nucleoid-associated protein [Nocardia sp. NBC_01503]|uniref:YbaB/EbfC family nucleoid-associated protein n=1 Tax=Nocardia sp. NBC_01503 TaxID=2975997 RepID=UPI002E7AF4C2|nr:YbaB/EbfC family nucleoid-associated protein [Nocardia sp. NBC_01503]WTL33761.1 YbaB/EbfC family nucleoid-associated protein [Nocardia sp. NBC_01503]